MKRLVFLRIAGALLVGLALCPLVPLLGRSDWPVWLGSFLGAFFGAAMLRTKPGVKIAAALGLGFALSLLREVAGTAAIDTTRYSLPIGFVAGATVYVALAVLNQRRRIAVAIAGTLLIAGFSLYHYGVVAATYDRYQKYVAERRWQAVLRSKTVELPKVDRVEIAPGVPATHGLSSGWKPSVPVAVTGNEAERLAAIWRRRRFRVTNSPAFETPTLWYVKFFSQGGVLLETEIRSPELTCLLHGIERRPGRQCFVVAEDSWEALCNHIEQAAPYPDTTRSVLECFDAQAMNSARDSKGAMAVYRKAIQLDPKNGDAYVGLAHGYLERNDYDSAIDAFTSALQLLPPREFQLLRERAETYMLRGNYQEAVDDFSESLKLSSDNESAIREMRGQAYLRLGIVDQALADFKSVVAELPDAWNSKFHLGVADRIKRGLEKPRAPAK